MIRCVMYIAAASLLLTTAGCPEGELACVEVDLGCAPLYEPTFTNVYNNTLVPTCAAEGGACHSPEGAKGGLSYMDEDSAYDLLLGVTDGRARVVPFDVECSLLVKRIESTRASKVMPPGDPLSRAERCAIEQWIANGAER
jgi:hypothetical protein